jgi:leader peptidase (prepilin peptidase)/N-methyltransferase
MLALYVLVGVLGLAVGSFLNVVIYRVPREESLLFPSSHCPRCDATIRSRHNIPLLGWLVLRGKCFVCKEKISARYPLVEGGTAALFVLVLWRFGLTLDLPPYLYLGAVAVALVMINFDLGRLPDSIVLPSYIVGALLLLPAGAVNADLWAVYRSILGMLMLLACYSALTIAYPTGLAFGDIKLAGLLGLYLGYLGWSFLLIGLFAGFLVSGIGGSAISYGIGDRSATITRPATRIGMGMITGAVLALFVAQPLATWYGSLLGTI